MKYIALFSSLILLLSACTSKNKNYDASGMFEATEVIVSAEATGKILTLNIIEGQKVEAFEPLGLIDTVQLYLQKVQLLQSKSQVGTRKQNIDTQLASLEEQLAYQQREKTRIEKLIAAKAGNTKQLDDINAQIAIIKKQIAATKENLEKNNQGVSDNTSLVAAQIAAIDDQLLKAHIKSPIFGTILVKYAEAGEVTAMGRPLFKVADVENIYLRAYITSAQLTQIKLGQQVKVYSDFGEKERREYNGTITWISSEAEFTPKTIQTKDERANLVYAIKILVQNDGYLKIGMYGDVRFN
ncbi:MAG: HlyD family efflux transporter periplasmic adaptor subunit [Bacteroidetes bacterium]|nr:HlyD family efflux transporter periplasmic adaptor subunit [Bacteroidota bacterium]MCL2302685.1 HlyD family efflux transporter periplasmic adaptor subunit [Lentimicrobiaceae bacterium]